MRVRAKSQAGLLLAVALLCVSCSSGTASPPPAEVSQPPEVSANSGTDWPLPGHDYTNSRAAVGSPIDASNVDHLTPAWQVNTAGALTTAAVIVGHTAYAEDDTGTVVAVDTSTGRTLWRSASTGYTVGPEGAVVGWGLVFAATANGAEALNEKSGKVVWTRRLTQSTTAGVDMQPTVVGHHVLISTVPVSIAKQFQGGDRGIIYSLDASTGKVDWSFDTVASKDLWGNPTVNSGGGAWYPPTIDTATGITYWGIGNPAPFPGTPQYPNGSSRPGPNLYTDSTVALDLSTGHLIWYHQVVPHDLSDQDFVNSLLVTIQSGGSQKQIVVGAGKGGQVVGMDPGTGRVLWQTTVGKHENHSLKALPAGPTEVLPGTYGGVLTPPASADGTVYVATLNAPSMLFPNQTSYFGGKTGTMDGELVAINAATGKIRWDTSVPGDPTGGATVVNNLVFTATLQGTIVAVNRLTGKVVWTYQAPAGVSGWPAVAGDLIVFPTGTLEGPPGHLLALRLTSG